MQRLSVAVLVVALAFCGLGCAKKQPHPYSSVDEVFVRYDVDNNGVITREEYVSQWKDKQKAATAWKHIDKQGNGFVDRTLANDVPLDVWSQLESDDMH